MTLTLQCQWWISFLALLCVGHLWNSVNKRREPSQGKHSLPKASCENLSFSLSPLPQTSPPFTTSLIDNLPTGHIKDLAAASRLLKPISPFSGAASEPSLCSRQHQWDEGNLGASHLHESRSLIFPPAVRGSLNAGQLNARQIPLATEFLEDSRDALMRISCETLN